jgi:hypothetical protein
MPDMLVKLYKLPRDWGFLAEQEQLGISIRKPIGAERRYVTHWVEKEFSKVWASETEMAFSNWPISCFIATQADEMIGFACYDATGLGFFGPTGVTEKCRGKGTGKALLLACLLDMRLKGYGYAVIGSVGPAEFYQKVVGAVIIPDSEPSVWEGMLYEIEEDAESSES